MSSRKASTNTITLGWKDLIGQANAPAAGATIPVWTQIGATAFSAYNFAVNDILWFYYHIQHDYAPGTAIFLHTHWIPSGTNVQPVRWEFTYSYAKGFNQANFDFAGATVVTADGTPPGTAYRHMVTEISTGVLENTITEPDGILAVRIRRVTNGGTDNTNNIFLLTADCHYQTDRHTTPNKAPNFYNE